MARRGRKRKQQAPHGQITAEKGFVRQNRTQSRFPWATMKVNESFRTTGDKPRFAAASQASKKYAPKHFVAGRDQKGETRIWRDK